MSGPEQVFLDDIGSYPLPSGVLLQSLTRDQYLSLVRDVLDAKAAAGVEVPTYPQLRDMIRMFMDPIQDPGQSASPYLIRRECARILELSVLRPGERVRVCVTGPLELYLSAFGSTCYSDILFRLAESVSRFLQVAREEGRMAVASLDEPSLGISSSIAFSDEEILQALEIASSSCRGMDCEVHLHSPIYAELCASVQGISIVGVESAAHPDYLRLIDRSVLEENDAYLRAGIARTDILSMVAGLNERLGLNLWKDIPRLEREVLDLESPQIIKARLRSAAAQFGERLRAVGPDCGLGSWPSQHLAGEILRRCADALEDLRRMGRC